MKDDIKTFRFKFHATLGQFFLNAAAISSPLTATWKRSSQSTSTSIVQMSGGKANFNQTITLPLNMYFEESKQIFQDKKTMFTFTMNTPKGEKQAGIVYVQVAQMLNNKSASLSDTFLLEKCPVKDSKVYISITAELVGEGASSDTVSIDSSMLMNQSSGPSTLSIESKKNIPSVSTIKEDVKAKPQSKLTVNPAVSSSELEEKDKIISNLEMKIKQLTKEKQQLSKQVERARAPKDEHNEASQLKQQLVKSKTIQQKLQNQITNLRSENIEHEKDLEKMRVRMEQIYQLLFSNLNSLY